MLKPVCWAAILLLAACSAMLDVEYDSVGHVCAPSGVKCLTGFHCRDLGNSKYCVPDHVVPEFGTCREDLDCNSAQKCIDFNCLRPCTALAALTDCPSNHYCHPYRSHAATGNIIGGCEPVDPCTTGSCGTGNTCLSLATSISTCLPKCNVDLSNNSADCAALSETFRCQIAGTDNTAVCMESVGTPVCPTSPNTSCNTVSKPCPNGQIVYNGSCRAWCDPNGFTCADGTTCCDSAVNDSARTEDGPLGLCIPENNCLN